MIIEGPALSITGEMASENRDRITGRDDTWNCQQHDESACGATANAGADQCVWSSALAACVGNTWSYYTGKGIELNTVDDVTVTGCTVKYTTNSGIRCDKCDNTTIDSNIVYGTNWWTHSATSAVVFAEALGSGTNAITNNIVYANRNFLPFFLTGSLAHFGSGVEHYGQWNQSVVVDGNGVYITRNLDYEGTFNLNDNVAYDNGINGLVVHKTTHENVTVNVLRNKIFDNGKTEKEVEGRQDAGGLTINTGDAAGEVLLQDNQVTASALPDRTYQCFGTCTLLAGSSGNTVCGGDYNTKLDSAAFATGTDCDQQAADFAALRALYPDAQMPLSAQYTPFLEPDLTPVMGADD